MIRDHIFCEANAPYMEAGTEDCITCDGMYEVDCPICEGSGIDQGEVCLQCNGRKYVSCPECCD